jgi:hypothetical protein
MYKILAKNTKTNIVTVDVAGVKFDIPIGDCLSVEDAKNRIEHVVMEYQTNTLERQRQDSILAGLT